MTNGVLPRLVLSVLQLSPQLVLSNATVWIITLELEKMETQLRVMVATTVLLSFLINAMKEIL